LACPGAHTGRALRFYLLSRTVLAFRQISQVYRLSVRQLPGLRSATPVGQNGAMNTTKPMGRPMVITNRVSDALELALRHGYGVAEACRWAGIGRTAYYTHLARDEAFARRMAAAKRWLCIKALLIIHDAIVIDRDSEIAKWYLERRDPAFMR